VTELYAAKVELTLIEGERVYATENFA